MSDDDSIDRAGLRRNTRRSLILIGVLVLVPAVVGVLIGTFHAGNGSRHPLVALAVLVGVAAVTFGAAVLMLRWMLRRAPYQRVMQYSWSQRRAAFKAVKAGRPLDPRQVRIVRATLDYTAKTRWFLWLLPLLVAILVLNGLTQHNLAGRLQLAAAALYVVGFPVLLWQRRRAIARAEAALARSG